MRSTPGPLARALAGALLIASSASFAQSEVAGSPPEATASGSKPIGEAWALRLRYGLAYRSGGQQDVGPGLTYSGTTFNDLALAGWGWLGYAGLHVQAQREAFSLNDGMGRVTGGGLVRFAAQLAGRLPLGPLRIEPYAGYALHELPAFRGPMGDGSSVAPAWGAVTRHSLLVALRLLFELGRIGIELRGELPVRLAASTPGAVNTVTNGFAAGGAIRVQIANAGKLHFGALLDGQFVSDNLAGKDAAGNDVVASQQRVVRAGLALDVQWRDPVAVGGATTGGVVVRVLDLQSGESLPGADVTITVAGEERPMSPDATGALAMRELPGGPFSVRASADGYLPLESAGSVTAGVDTPIEVRLQKEPPKVGGLSISVKEVETGKPLPGVTVTVGASTAKTDDKGVASFEGLKPGPVAIAMALEGYQKGEEAASVVGGKTTAVNVTLVPEKKKLPATINGIVRSTKGGTPVAADLEIPQLKMKTKADAKGAFTFTVDGGTYTVKISAPGYITQTKDVTVKDGDRAIFNVDLYPR